jgi:hypothetical protein
MMGTSGTLEMRSTHRAASPRQGEVARFANMKNT